MSYSFSWDCTLPINNIQDIISINIVPKTKTYDEGNYLSLRGHICIEGEYVAHSHEHHNFDEKIPLDITLPNNGNCDEIETEVTNFDYEVKHGKILFLKVDLILAGYELEIEAPIAEAVSYEPARDELDYSELEETVLDEPIEAIEFSEESVQEDEVSEIDTESEEVEKRKEQFKKEVEKTKVSEAVAGVAEKLKPLNVAETITETVVEVAEKLKPSHVAETVTETVVEVAEKLKPSHVTETVTEVAEKLKPSHVAETVVEVAEKLKPSQVVETVTEVAEKLKPIHMVEKVTEVAEKVEPSPVETEVIEEEVKVKKEESIVKSYKPKKPKHKKEAEKVLEDEVTPFPIKSEKIHEKAKSKPSKKSNLFDMLYDLEAQPAADELLGYETVSPELLEEMESKVSEKVFKEEIKDVAEEKEKSFFDDSIASQFADGASIIKIIYIQEELTISAICDQYEITEQHICNLEALESPLKCGDRVMINYGRVQ